VGLEGFSADRSLPFNMPKKHVGDVRLVVIGFRVGLATIFTALSIKCGLSLVDPFPLWID
jgi:hypothetical protein